jgi:hypothetical protein
VLAGAQIEREGESEKARRSVYRQTTNKCEREREIEPPLVIISWCFLGEEPSPGSEFSVS